MISGQSLRRTWNAVRLASTARVQAARLMSRSTSLTVHGPLTRWVSRSSGTDQNHKPGRPRKLGGDELTVALQFSDQRRNPGRVPFRPRELGQKVVDEIDSTYTEQRKRKVQVRELAGPRISVDEVEVQRC